MTPVKGREIRCGPWHKYGCVRQIHCPGPDGCRRRPRAVTFPAPRRHRHRASASGAHRQRRRRDHRNCAALRRGSATIRASVDGLKPDGAAPNHGHIPFTARAKQTLENSLTEAQRRSHQHVDAEHLLWAVTQDPDATSSKAVTASAICIDTVRTRLEERWNDAEQHPPGGI